MRSVSSKSMLDWRWGCCSEGWCSNGRMVLGSDVLLYSELILSLLSSTMGSVERYADSWLISWSLFSGPKSSSLSFSSFWGGEVCIWAIGSAGAAAVSEPRTSEFRAANGRDSAGAVGRGAETTCCSTIVREYSCLVAECSNGGVTGVGASVAENIFIHSSRLKMLDHKWKHVKKTKNIIVCEKMTLSSSNNVHHSHMSRGHFSRLVPHLPHLHEKLHEVDIEWWKVGHKRFTGT